MDIQEWTSCKIDALTAQLAEARSEAARYRDAMRSLAHNSVYEDEHGNQRSVENIRERIYHIGKSAERAPSPIGYTGPRDETPCCAPQCELE